MAKSRTSYICQQCGYVSPSLLGRCPECQNWNSFVETIEEKTNSGLFGSAKERKTIGQITYLGEIEKKEFARKQSGLGEFDRVLGGGIVAGSIILLAGDPGIGKSTLLTQIALTFDKALYVAGEESAQQIKLRADRIAPKSNLPVLTETDVDIICGTIEQFKPSVVVVDSIQTIETSDLNAAPGSVSQVRESAHRLQKFAKRMHIPIIIIGHVTKEGTVAGPRTLEHLVDVVLSLEGDPNTNFRVLRTTKNRFGATDEVGIFEMEEAGMKEVTNPSEMFLEQKVVAPGAAIMPTINGLRPIMVEIQALVVKTNIPVPRRVGTGIDNNRLQLLVAVLSKRLNMPLYSYDIFVNVTGGLKITEPAADLAICMAIISSFKDQSLPERAAYVGEVGLLGELRSVRQLAKRTSEAKNLGFDSVISPEVSKNLVEVVNKSFKKNSAA